MRKRISSRQLEKVESNREERRAQRERERFLRYEKEDYQRHRKRRWATIIVVLLGVFLPAASILIGVDQFNTQTVITRAQFQEASIVRAWNLLKSTSEQGGNSGQLSALQFLHRANQSLVAQHLGCLNENVQRYRNKECVTLNSINLAPTDSRQNVNLAGSDLSGADLISANLTSANLTVANLSGANLAFANLTKADLRWSNLSRATLSEADLTGALLNGAKLNGAVLNGAKLNGADLTGADLTQGQLNVACMDEGGRNPKLPKGLNPPFYVCLK